MSRRVAFLLCAGLSLASAAEAAAEPLLVVDMEQAEPYAFNTAVLSCSDGLSGTVRVEASGIDGGTVGLFEERLDYAASAEAVFYVDYSMTALRFTAADGHGRPLAATVDLDAALRRQAPDSVREAAYATLEALGFPFREAPAMRIPSSLRFEIDEPERVAAVAQRRLFGPRRSPWLLAALALWSAAAVAVAALKAGRRRLLVTLVAAALATAAMGAAASRTGRRAELYLLELPPAGLPFEAHGEAERKDGYAIERWGDGATTPFLVYIGVRSPLDHAVPTAEFDAFEAVRWKSPPAVVRGKDGVPRLAAGAYRAAWALRYAPEAAP